MRRARTVATVALTFALTACGSGEQGDRRSAAAPSNAGPSVPQFGDACAAIPADPADAGSFEAMAIKPVVAALSGNGSLSLLTVALKRAGLTGRLDDAQALTVFAPTDGAFDKLPDDRQRALEKDNTQLAKTLLHHVIPERLGPAQLTGRHTTMNSDMVTVSDQGGVVEVDGSAMVVCANVQTKNATVYIVDAVLAPGSHFK